jgi:hypothetical protein
MPLFLWTKHALEYLRAGKAKGKVVLLTKAYKS